jgi:hypothetical protein
MRARNGEEELRIGGPANGNDWIYPLNGGGTREVPSDSTKAQGTLGTPTISGSDANGTTPVQAAPWFAPVEDDGCKDGVCPVPWANQPWSTKPYRPELQPDLVNHPPHYTDGSIECIDAIEAQLTPEEWRGYLKGSIAKYNWRERHKGGTESLKKARFYLDRLIMFDEN